MSKVLINVKDLRMDDCWDRAFISIVIYAYIANYSEFFGGFVNASVKSIANSIFGNCDEASVNRTKQGLEWLLKHDYVKLHCINESKYFYALELGDNEDSVWETWMEQWNDEAEKKQQEESA